jgi:predicted transcriptional regulator
MEPSRTISVLDRMLEPLSDCLNPEAAQRIVALGIDPDVQARIAKLADRSSEGLLNAEGRAEYASYVEGAEILSLIKLKARRFLLKHPGN